MVVGSLVDHPLNGQKQTDIRLLKIDIALYDTLYFDRYWDFTTSHWTSSCGCNDVNASKICRSETWTVGISHLCWQLRTKKICELPDLAILDLYGK